MYSHFLFLILALVAGSAYSADCGRDTKDYTPTEWITDNENVTCTNAVLAQIDVELKASANYLAMGAHFAKDSVNLLGFSNLFFEAAGEEREHAIKLMDYLTMRGKSEELDNKLLWPECAEDKSSLSAKIVCDQENRMSFVVDSGKAQDALQFAVSMEAAVTRSVRSLLQTCEGDDATNDYHLVDYLTADFLDEQHKGTRDLAGKSALLGRMIETHGNIAEFLFDKKLLGAQMV